MKTRLISIAFEQCNAQDPIYKAIRDRHYIPDHGTIGRQIHYIIHVDNKAIGIISGASAVWSCKPRDEFFGITKHNRRKVVQQIINNTVFRLEITQHNLASQILSLWRKRVIKDWQEKYCICNACRAKGIRPPCAHRDQVIGFETFVHGEQRNGHIYLADNWAFVGMTKGSHRVTTSNASNIQDLANDFYLKGFDGQVTTSGQDAQGNNVFRMTAEQNKKLIFVRLKN